MKLRKPKEHPMKQVLENRGISQTMAAYQLGIDRGHLSRVLSGLSNPSLWLAARIDELYRKLFSEEEELEK